MAIRYWVGGTGTWTSTSTANWSATSGGAAGASAPTAADDVVFDAGSGSGTCTTDATAICRGMTMNSANMSLVLGANFSAAPGLPWDLQQGTLNINDYTLTCSAMYFTGALIRTLAFGNSTGKIVVTANNTTIIFADDVSNLTITGTKIFECTYSGAVGTRTFFGPGNTGTEATAFDVYVTAGSDVIELSTTTLSRRYRTINFDGFTGTLQNWPATIYGNFKLNSSMTLAAGANAITFAATSGAQQITTAGKTLDFPLVFNGVNAASAFQDALTQGSTRSFTVTSGTVRLKNGVTSTVI